MGAFLFLADKSKDLHMHSQSQMFHKSFGVIVH